jgi:imidazolonepropionase-like amidohydrolase
MRPASLLALCLLASSPLPALAGEVVPPAPTRAEGAERAHRQIEPDIPAGDALDIILRGGTVMTASGEVHTPGWVHLRDGRIAALGAGDPPTIAGSRLVDVSGSFVTPGLIDTHSHLGVYPSPSASAHSDGNEAVAATTAGVWAEHATWPQDPGFERAAAGGVTTLQILPGSANLIGGRGVVLHVVPARGPRAMRFPGAPETVKMACGENPKRVYGDKGGPQTRMGNVYGRRKAFFAAQRYLDEWSRWEAKQNDPKAKGKKKGPKKGKKGDEESDDAPPEFDPALETLSGILTGEFLVQTHCYRADDMLGVLQVADEFGFHIRSFHHALEAYKIRDILAERQVASSTWADWWGFKMEAYDGIPYNAALLTESGAIAIIHSDSSEGIQRLNQEASKAYWSGKHVGIDLTENDALRWITANPAWALGIDDQVGTLEAGKRADIVVWDAHPFSIYAKARWVFVDGRLRWSEDEEPIWSDFELGRNLR